MEITIAVLITFIITFCMTAMLVNLACKDPYIEMDFMNPPKENSYGFGVRKKGKTKTFNEFYCTSEEIERKDKIIEQLTKEKDELEKELQARQVQCELLEKRIESKKKLIISFREHIANLTESNNELIKRVDELLAENLNLLNKNTELCKEQTNKENEKELKLCTTCKFSHISIYNEPCKSCGVFTKNNYIHK